MEQKIYRGEIYYADLSPIIGSEQGGVRPVIVIQNNKGNMHSPTVIVAAITKRSKPDLPTHVLLHGLACLKEDSIVLLEQLRTIDKQRLQEYIGEVTKPQKEEINHALAVSVGLIKNVKEPIELCLCSICVEQFRMAKSYHVSRVDRNQKEKGICTFCNTRYGFDYQIQKK